MAAALIACENETWSLIKQKGLAGFASFEKIMRSPLLTTFQIVGLLVALALVAIIFVHRSTGLEGDQIRARYQQMRTALSSNDTNAALALIAPKYRSSFHSNEFTRLNYLAQPLGPESTVAISGDEARVCPTRSWHFLILPGGNTIEMIKVNGDWFFTSDVHVD